MLDEELRSAEQQLISNEQDESLVRRLLRLRRRSGTHPVLADITDDDIMFFWEWAGWDFGKRLQGAIDLALAEHVVRTARTYWCAPNGNRYSWTYDWASDDEAWIYYLDNIRRRRREDRPSEILSVSLYEMRHEPAIHTEEEERQARREPVGWIPPRLRGSPYRLLASTGGLEDPSPEERRLTEAQLALQAINESQIG
jgi:hypothetical protein